jgi:hypothetical protein
MEPGACRSLGLVVVAILSIVLFGSNAHAAGPGDNPAGLPNPNETTVEEKPSKPDFVSVYSGFEGVKDANLFYGGFDIALNGDLSRRGFVFSGYGAVGNYTYQKPTVPGGSVDGDLTELSALLGYQVFAGSVSFLASAGVDWQNNDLSPPDPANPVSGSTTNFVTGGAIERRRWDKPLYFKLFGSYTINNNSYWAKGRIGYNFGKVIIGPEGAWYGNENFNSQRAGAFITLPLLWGLSLDLGGGFNFVANKEFFSTIGSSIEQLPFGGLGGVTNGGYGTVVISRSF